MAVQTAFQLDVFDLVDLVCEADGVIWFLFHITKPGLNSYNYLWILFVLEDLAVLGLITRSHY